MLLFAVTNTIRKFIKFGIVGVLGTIIDFSITYLCKEVFKVQKYIANAIGFTVAATHNYILNRVWTFRSSNPEVPTEFILFFIISVIGLLLNTLIIWLMSGKLKYNFYLSKVVATFVVVFWNFFANLLITFAK